MNLKARAKKLSDSVAKRRRILLVSAFLFVFSVIALSPFLESVSILNKTTVASIISILSIIGGVLLNLIINDIPVTAMLRFLNILRIIAFVVLGVLPLAYIIARLSFLSAEDFLTAVDFVNTASEQALLDATMAGLAATVFGIAAGIPVAFWLSSKQQQAVEAKEKAEEEKERTEREKIILAALWEELSSNQVILETVIEVHGKELTKKTNFELQDVLWRAFSDGGELKWIDDLRIFRSLSLAYGQVATLIHLERQYTDISELPNIVLGPREEQNAIRARRIRPVALAFIKTAVNLIRPKIAPTK